MSVNQRWFNNKDNLEKLLAHVPQGKANNAAHIEGTNYNNIYRWISLRFEWLTNLYIRTFKQMFVCKAYDINMWNNDYNIPNDIFYPTDDEEHQKDVYVMKYLMKGNHHWNYQAIANIYDIDVEIYAGRDYYRQDGFVYDFPIPLGARMTNDDVLVIVFRYDKNGGFIYNFPFRFIRDRIIDKLKMIYATIKPSHIKIIYEQDDTINNERINLCEN